MASQAAFVFVLCKPWNRLPGIRRHVLFRIAVMDTLGRIEERPQNMQLDAKGESGA